MVTLRVSHATRRKDIGYAWQSTQGAGRDACGTVGRRHADAEAWRRFAWPWHPVVWRSSASTATKRCTSGA